jgi:hypothetical protein
MGNPAGTGPASRGTPEPSARSSTASSSASARRRSSGIGSDAVACAMIEPPSTGRATLGRPRSPSVVLGPSSSRRACRSPSVRWRRSIERRPREGTDRACSAPSCTTPPAGSARPSSPPRWATSCGRSTGSGRRPGEEQARRRPGRDEGYIVGVWGCGGRSGLPRPDRGRGPTGPCAARRWRERASRCPYTGLVAGAFR